MRAASISARILFALAALGAAEVCASAQTVYPIVLERDQKVIGSGRIQNIQMLSINPGGFFFALVFTDYPVSTENLALVLNGYLTLPEDATVSLPDGTSAQVENFLSLDSNKTGYLGMILDLRGTNVTNKTDTGVFWNTQILAREGDTVLATHVNGTALDASSTYVSFDQAHINSANQILVTGVIQDPSFGTAAQTETALWLYDTDSAGSVVSETILLMRGKPFPGTTETVNFAGSGGHPNSSALSESGDWMTVARIGSSTSSDAVVVHNGNILAREGSPAPDPTGANRVWMDLYSSKVATNSLGDTMYTGLMAGGGLNAALVVNGEPFMLEGGTFPSISPSVIANFGAAPPIFITDSGDVFWSGNTTAAVNEQYYFRNQEVIIREGGPVGNDTVRSLWAAEYAFDVSSNGRFFLGKVTVDSGGDALFLADFGALVPTPGCSGNPGTLKRAGGEAQIDQSFTLEMDNAQGVGVTPLIVWSLDGSDVNECGTDTKRGELLISLLQQNVVASTFGPTYMGSPVQMTFDIPNDPALVDLKVYGQGAFLDMGGATSTPVQLTNGFSVEVGM